MNLLVVTQKIDRLDENLGFFCRWLEEMQKHFTEVRVIAASVKSDSVPVGIEAFSFGKDAGFGKIKRIWNYLELFSKYYAQSDAVFFHMVPEFVLVSSPFIWALKKPSALWYTHKQVTPYLKFAEKIVDNIFTASEMSFRIPSSKTKLTGHAIDTETFNTPQENYFIKGRPIKLLVLGRVSPVKNIEVILQACNILKKTWRKTWCLSVVGGPLMPRDHKYLNGLKEFVRSKNLEDRIIFTGSLPHNMMSSIYKDHDIFISMSGTGSIDKAVLEAMASGNTVITANESFQNILPEECFMKERNPELLAEKIKNLAKEKRPNEKLRNVVVAYHSLEKTMAKVAETIKSSK